jgi:hypothetical protein
VTLAGGVLVDLKSLSYLFVVELLGIAQGEYELIVSAQGSDCSAKGFRAA